MVDIFVKDLVKSFEVGNNLLDGLSFEVQQGERVGLLGKTAPVRPRCSVSLPEKSVMTRAP